jgi:ligand-binding SRPBCC domain-containing protein
MKTFEYEFVVKAPLSAVSSFHHDSSILKKLTPPPVFIQIHEFEPLADGSTAKLTMWFGPVPVKWTAVHSNVSEGGFTDTQLLGPLKYWQHTHRFHPVNDHQTLIKEHIDYAYDSGLRGLLSRLVFNRAGLFLLFSTRKWLTRRHVGRQLKQKEQRSIAADTPKF